MNISQEVMPKDCIEFMMLCVKSKSLVNFIGIMLLTLLSASIILLNLLTITFRGRKLFKVDLSGLCKINRYTSVQESASMCDRFAFNVTLWKSDTITSGCSFFMLSIVQI